MQPFTKRVIEIIQRIPEGYVMTYGQIAEVAGSPRGARQVVRILHSMSAAHKLPWHRVVNAKGIIALMDEESRFKQILYLSSEGVLADEAGRVDLEKHRYWPEETDNFAPPDEAE
ncbi:MGMT family protein [Paenibacillus paeoniae]|uniref:DNA methyltransferase n=1 Tax=Paenibacillus paeoniae TaxID=2292705 RepID=A0A371P8S0_9BACL|nr:MGMT family protein [Paenibacillus paeoniae]REK71890.1 DNA methyltransferase [Paenibacillus paeoniae]